MFNYQIIIGHLGANAELKEANGHKFITFRLAHTERWRDQAGVDHEETTWVDCIINGESNVLPFLVKGQMVAVIGTCRVRAYPSEKDRCWKGGLTINVMRCELLGGKGDGVPSTLYTTQGTAVQVTKYFNVQSLASCVLYDKSLRQYQVDANGWVFPSQQATEPQATEPQATEPQATEPQATEPQATEPQATDAPFTGEDTAEQIKIKNNKNNK